MTGIPLVKAHAYGNDFLLVPDAAATGDRSALARALCHRHHGVGADGVIVYTVRGASATMRLWNADGSPSELSGNGLRCLAALVAREAALVPRPVTALTPEPASVVTVDTTAGVKTLDLLARDGERYTFRAAMGHPEHLREVDIAAAGETLRAVVLAVGNPQCIVLGPLPDPERFNRLGPALATHPMFPEGTNVEFVQVEDAGTLRILIWERGVGPTTSSGTGTSASAVAAAAYGGARRTVDVHAPGGSQRVEWTEQGILLTGWAELVLDGRWTGQV